MDSDRNTSIGRETVPNSFFRHQANRLPEWLGQIADQHRDRQLVAKAHAHGNLNWLGLHQPGKQCERERNYRVRKGSLHVKSAALMSSEIITQELWTVCAEPNCIYCGMGLSGTRVDGFDKTRLSERGHESIIRAKESEQMLSEQGYQGRAAVPSTCV